MNGWQRRRAKHEFNRVKRSKTDLIVPLSIDYFFCWLILLCMYGQLVNHVQYVSLTANAEPFPAHYSHFKVKRINLINDRAGVLVIYTFPCLLLVSRIRLNKATRRCRKRRVIECQNKWTHFCLSVFRNDPFSFFLSFFLSKIKKKYIAFKKNLKK